ncbi:TonB-dependent receptor [Robiginitalea marina]|uniref:TonB-dependent receptor n=1 Tax=Robiginitalea marina TaxID=2954105 RepID=A0ABT1AYF9_9FLAO|nr:TonB-dependent receptor [Robiginitalea marina]MCO5725073.1 TonB-dependent receptor [Robiginitalea marina]
METARARHLSNRRYQLFLLVTGLFLSALCHAQETLSGAPQERVETNASILKLEQETGYRFFFLEEWTRDIPEEVDLSGLTLSEALDTLLANTPLNYYILEDEKRVFLLENTLIYDELPKHFFGRKDTLASETTEGITAPRPVPSFLAESVQRTARKYPIARIGKASSNQLRQRYTLRGRATNESTGEPIPDLTIRLSGTNRVTITDEQGNYSMDLPPGYNVLSITAIGIENMEREIVMYNDGTLNLAMEEGLEQLDEVVVEADAISNVEETSTGKETIDLEESRNIPLVLGERDLLQVAKALPGISSAGEGATGLNVRGGKTDQNLVLLDDAVIYNPTHFFGIFQALNPFTTKGADIYKASVPVEFGGRLSSVFDIRTKNGNVERFSGEGSIGPVTGNLALEIPVKKDTSSLVVGGRGAYADWILRSLEEESLNNSEASFFDVIAKYHHRFNDQSEIRATAYFSRDDFSITSDSLYNYTNRLASVRWDHRHSNKTVGALMAANSDYRFGIDFDGQANTDFDLTYRINETELKYKLNTRLNDKHSLDYGISSKFYSVNPGSIEPMGSDSDIVPVFIDEEQAIEGALFVGDEIALTDNLSLDLGLRYAFFAALGPGTQRTYFEGQPRNEATVQDTLRYNSGEVVETYGGPEARVSLRYLLAPDFSVKASFNNAYQFVHTLTNNTTVSPIDTWKLSDLNIEPQTGYQASLGFYKNFNDNMYEVSVEGYYKRMDNVLDFKTGADLFLNEHVETEVLQGEGKAYGIEFLIKKNRGKLNGWLGYTYARSLYRFDSQFSEERINGGEFFPSNFDKPHDLSLIANYKLTRRYSFSVNFVYQTGRPVTYPIGTFRFNNADFVAFSDRNEFRIPDFYRLDLGINIEGNHRKNKLVHSFWTISVYNVLGRNNPYSVFFVTEGGEVKALQSSIFAIPIPSITYNFKF